MRVGQFDSYLMEVGIVNVTPFDKSHVKTLTTFMPLIKDKYTFY